MIKIKFLVLFFVIFSTSALGQYRLTGTVLDETGEAMIGANINVTGEKKATVTDINGGFSIPVDSKKVYELTVSYVGYTEKKFTLEPDKPIQLKMELNAQMLDEFVVVGYNVVKKSHLTGAVSTLKGDEVVINTTTDATAALQGKIAGVVVERNSGSPGAGVSVKVRGIGTLGSTEPLYVVDGIYSGSLMLSAEDIESIEVLKDASAAAIYGAQAANGVVLVTSKKGKKGIPKVEFSTNIGVQSADGLPQMADGVEYTQYWHAAFQNDGKLNEYPTYLLPDSVSKGTDWYKEVYKPALFYRNNIRISGGSEYLSSSLSLNNTRQDGTYVNTSYEDYGVLFNSNFDKGRWHFGTTMNLNQNERTGIYDAGQLSTLTYSPLAVRAKDDGTFDDGLYDYQQGFDPVYYAKNFTKNWESSNFTGLVFAKLDILKGLSLRVNFNYNYAISTFLEHNKSIKIPGRVDPSISSRIESHSKNYGTRSELLVNYNNTFGVHTINSVVGISKGQYHWENLWIRADDLIEDELPVLSGSKQINPGLSEGGDLGYFGQLNYSYDNRYLLGASVRRDGSSKFYRDYRYGIFPSVSLGWNMHNEKFFKVPVINELKLRGSYGRLGNSAIGEYMYETAVDIIAERLGYIIGKEQLWNGAAQLSYASPGVHWETSTTWNVGTDIALFDNRLSASAEVYERKTSGALVAVPLPLYTGSLSDPAQNIGSLRNRGFELSATYRGHHNKLKYHFTGNISFIGDKVLSLGAGNERPIYGGYVGNLENGVNITKVGHSIAEFYLIKTDGIFRTQEELDAHVWTNPETGVTNPIQPKAQPGDVRYVDFNNDGQITDADKQFSGKSAPDFYYSATFHLEYDHFDLDLFFNGEQNKKIFNYAAREAIAPQTVWPNVKSGLLADSWSPENINAKYPRIGLTDPNGNGDIFTDRWLEDGSFLRLQNVQLGYTLPKSLMQKVKIDNLRFYLNATNLFTLTKYSFGNPEVGREAYINEAYSVLRRGVNSWQYPMFRTYSIGMQLSF